MIRNLYARLFKKAVDKEEKKMTTPLNRIGAYIFIAYDIRKEDYIIECAANKEFLDQLATLVFIGGSGAYLNAFLESIKNSIKNKEDLEYVEQKIHDLCINWIEQKEKEELEEEQNFDKPMVDPLCVFGPPNMHENEEEA